MAETDALIQPDARVPADLVDYLLHGQAEIESKVVHGDLTADQAFRAMNESYWAYHDQLGDNAFKLIENIVAFGIMYDVPDDVMAIVRKPKPIEQPQAVKSSIFRKLIGNHQRDHLN